MLVSFVFQVKASGFSTSNTIQRSYGNMIEQDNTQTLLLSHLIIFARFIIINHRWMFEIQRWLGDGSCS